MASTYTLGPGFPLDDAWIYQTYARNLIEYKDWVYIPGEVAGGATGPLWVLLLAVGRLINVSYLWWAYLLGILLATATGYISYFIFRRYFSQKPVLPLLGSILVIAEWHLVWASVSGMETIMFVLIVSAVFYGLSRCRDEGFCWWVGLLIGLGVWVRPEAITLILPTIMIFLYYSTKQYLLKQGIYLALGLGIPIGLYLAFNLWTSGAFFPTTYFAKQTEYAVLRNLPLGYRFVKVASQPLVGVGAIFLPAFLAAVWWAYRKRDLWIMSAGVWIVAFLGMYSVRLPVIYQHGRYEMPVIPIYLIIGWIGLDKALSLLPPQKSWSFILGKSWQIIIWITSAAFLVMGANAYRLDVAVIESEMVQISNWIRHNTSSDAIIAAHDIGAIGYFSGRQLIDLAGLISPDVVSIIRDETALRAYLKKNSIDYIATFPGWYHSLMDGCELVYQTNSRYTIEVGGENMAVYSCRFEN